MQLDHLVVVQVLALEGRTGIGAHLRSPLQLVPAAVEAHAAAAWPGWPGRRRTACPCPPAWRRRSRRWRSRRRRLGRIRSSFSYWMASVSQETLAAEALQVLRQVLRTRARSGWAPAAGPRLYRVWSMRKEVLVTRGRPSSPMPPTALGDPHGIAAEQLVVFGGAQVPGHAQLHDEVVHDFLGSALGEHARSADPAQSRCPGRWRRGPGSWPRRSAP